MRRRVLIATFGGVAAAPHLVWAQSSDRVRLVGLLLSSNERDPQAPLRIEAFRRGLKDAGWRDGSNIRVETRLFAGNFELAKTGAKELVALAPDVIVAQSTLGIEAALSATRSIPIVFVLVGFPVGSGYVASLARPGGNVTGLSAFEPEIGGKWLQALREIAPGIQRVAGILDPAFAAYAEMWRTVVTMAPSFQLAASTLAVQTASEIEAAIARFARSPDGGLVILPVPTNSLHRNLLIALARRHRLPAIYPFRYFAADGGLISYGLDISDLMRRSAGYVDRILKGANPGMLPVEAPTKFELVINLKTAKELGLTVPPTLLASADEFIE